MGMEHDLIERKMKQAAIDAYKEREAILRNNLERAKKHFVRIYKHSESPAFVETECTVAINALTLILDEMT